MSQDYTIDSFLSSHVAQTDLANMEKNHECHRSFFSGATAPSNAVAGHPWFDTTQNLPKIRNDANNAWLATLTGTTSQKIWIYRNDTDDGWAIDATVTDRVLSLKGGSGLYNVNGGNTAGETWANLKAHTHSIAAHNHQWYDARSNSQYDATYDSNGDITNIVDGDTKNNTTLKMILSSGSTSLVSISDAWTDSEAASNSGAQSTADVRPAAAVGTLQYPDI